MILLCDIIISLISEGEEMDEGKDIHIQHQLHRLQRLNLRVQTYV